MQMEKITASNFIEEEVIRDIESDRFGRAIQTRFPPEPNGYLHIGHAKAICIDFLTAKKFGGKCNLRFDDTNPTKEDTEYVESIQDDIRWLGFQWDELRYASSYFDTYYECALKLIREGKAYVCHLNAEQMREYRGTLTQPGKESPYRNRSVEENLDLFERMKNGEFPEGTCVLRAKIDMASPNMNMRDPALYRINHIPHHQTGTKWCIYPMYDFAHPIEDAVENVTHSLCSLEFEDHRPLYDWVLENCGFVKPPRQIEFARLNITRVPMSKRYLRRLVEENLVEGWDDPRMSTLAGLRRRGYTPESIIDFCQRAGVAKANSEVDAALLEHCVREDAKMRAPRLMAVLDPIELELVNYPEEGEMLEIENNPENPEMGTRKVSFSKHVYIERDDFMEEPPKKFFRLAPGREVRLKGAYIIKCEEVVKDEDGNIVKLLCSVDMESRSGMPGADRKVKGTLHWVDKATAVKSTVRLYDYLLIPDDGTDRDVTERFNTESIQVMDNAYVEKALAEVEAPFLCQFLRLGFFCADSVHYTAEHPVFNRTVGLKDSWAKAQNK
ncbi:MAG: glutamine--tRNA ligase/YqeY domain fusion protein [Clostridia bacterium]|nr:glutamine--tRNA ligase/YqeY domain fusion protein [Clostridia bacterium]